MNEQMDEGNEVREGGREERKREGLRTGEKERNDQMDKSVN